MDPSWSLLDEEFLSLIKPIESRRTFFLWNLAAIAYSIFSAVLIGLSSTSEFLILIGISALSILAGIKTKNIIFPFSLSFTYMLSFSILWQIFFQRYSGYYFSPPIVEMSFLSGILGYISVRLVRKKGLTIQAQSRENLHDILHTDTPRTYHIYSSLLSAGVSIDRQGIHESRNFFRNIDVPYTSITKCIYSRGYSENKCTVEYRDSENVLKTVEFLSSYHSPFGPLELYNDILKISRRRGYNIESQVDRHVIKFSRRLKDLGIENEVREPDDISIRITSPKKKIRCAKWELGSLCLKHENIEQIDIGVTEHAELVTTTHHSGGGYSVHGGSSSSSSYTTYTVRYDFEYQLTVLLEDQGIPQLRTYGSPVKEMKGAKGSNFWIGLILTFLSILYLVSGSYSWIIGLLLGLFMVVTEFISKKLIDYKWQENQLGKKLNSNKELTEMLLEVEAPPMKITNDHIEMTVDHLPTEKEFQCIDRIAELMHTT